MKLHSTYRGVNIYHQNEPGKLNWFSIVPSLAANTLAGLKQLICRHVDE